MDGQSARHSGPDLGPGQHGRYLWRAGAAIALAMLLVLIGWKAPGLNPGRHGGPGYFGQTLLAADYAAAMIAVVPLAPALIRRFGTRAVFLTVVALWGGMDALFMLESGTAVEVATQIVQGACGGLVVALATVIVAEAGGEARIAGAVSLLLIPELLEPYLSPRLDGLFKHFWRGIDLTGIVVCLTVLIAGRIILLPGRRDRQTRTSRASLLLAVAGLALLVYGATRFVSPAYNNSPGAWGPFAGGCLCLVLFVVHAVRHARSGGPVPALRVELHHSRVFAAAALGLLLLGVLKFGLNVAQFNYMDGRAVDDGLQDLYALGIPAFCTVLSLPFSVRYADRHGPGRVAFIAAALTTLTTVPLCFVGHGTPIGWVVLLLALGGIAVGAALVATEAAALDRFDLAQLVDGAPLVVAYQTLGIVLGGPGAAYLLVRLGGWRAVFIVGVGVALLATAVCVWLRRAEAGAAPGS